MLGFARVKSFRMETAAAPPISCINESTQVDMGQRRGVGTEQADFLIVAFGKHSRGLLEPGAEIVRPWCGSVACYH